MSTRSDEEKAARRGRGFQCVRCLKKGVEYINIKSRVEDHIRKTHLAPDQLPYYCTLCLFRCTKKEDLQRHVTHYRGHIARLQDNKGNRMPDSPDFLIENPNPYILGSDSDYIKLSKSDSRVHFLLKSKAEETLPTDIIAQAAKEIINPVPETEETPLIPTTEASTTVKDPAIQPIWQMFLSMLEVNKQKGLPLPSTATIPAGQNSFLPSTPAPTAPVSPSVPLAMQVPETVYPGLSMLGASSMPYNVWKQPIVTSVVTASWPIVNQTLPPLTYTMPMTNCLLPATSSRQMEPLGTSSGINVTSSGIISTSSGITYTPSDMISSTATSTVGSTNPLGNTSPCSTSGSSSASSRSTSASSSPASFFRPWNVPDDDTLPPPDAEYNPPAESSEVDLPPEEKSTLPAPTLQTQGEPSHRETEEVPDQTHEEQPPATGLVDKTHEEQPPAVAVVDQNHEDQPPAAAVVDQTHEEQPPAVVDQTHGDQPPAAAVVDQSHEEQPPAAGLVDQNNTSGKVLSHNEAADEGQEENILPQLLGEENIQLSVSGDLRRVQLKDDGEKPLILETLATLAETVRQGNKTTRTELESNSRTVRCLEKTVSAELKENNRLLNEINLNLINLITYLRTNAREERRRREKEEEKQREIETERRKEEQKRKDDERKRKRDEKENDDHPPLKIKSVLGEVKKNKKNK